MIFDKLKQIKIEFILFVSLFVTVTPSIAFESRDYLLIHRLVNSCHKNTESCNEALLKIHKYQKNAALNKKFSCQTRLLGLEANLIMAMNSNLKRKEAKSIIDSIKKYC